MLSTLKKATAAAFIAAGVMTTVGATSAQAEVPFTYEGCPYGAVCVYPQDAGWNGGNPSAVYYSYGAHNLSNQYGYHRVFNNQYGGANAWTTTGYDGYGALVDIVHEFTYGDYDLTPINSISLNPTGG